MERLKNEISLLKLQIDDLVSCEESRIVYALKKFRFNQVKASEFLGITSKTIWRKIKDYNIKKEDIL